MLQILLVEDDEDAAHFIESALNTERYRTTRLTDGEQALTYLLHTDKPPDVVLMDYHLPFMNGLEIIRRTKEAGKELAYIFLTVDTTVDIALEAMKAGALDFLPKTGKFYTELPAMIEKVHGIHTDIVEKKQAEEALKQAKEAAEAANRAKSEFIANMSHELRTPLNAVLGFSQLLQRDPNLTDQQRDYVAIILRNGDHLLLLLNDILDLSNIEAGQLQLEPVSFNISSILKILVDMTRFRAQQKGLEFCYEEDPDIPYALYGDSKRLRQVLLNLLGNAVKFTEKGRVTLRVRLGDGEMGRWGDGEMGRSGDGENGRTGERESLPHLPISASPHLIFEVEDTGIGIPAERLEQIFLPFEQVKDGRLYFGGIGLGLAISRRLLHIMGSELHVRSVVGQGSTFWFDLNFSESAATPIEGEETFWKKFLIDQQRVVAPDVPIIPPPPELLARLHELTLIGDIMGIGECLEEIDGLDAKFHPFTARIHPLAKTLQVSEIQKFLQPYLKE